MALTESDWQQIGAKIRALAAAENMRLSHWVIQNLFWVTDERPNPPTKRKFRAEFVQQRFLEEMWCLTVILKARQHGISLTCALLQLFYCLFRANYKAGIVDRTDLEGREKLKRIKFAYDHLDDQDDPNAAIVGAAIKHAIPLIRANEHELAWANGSQVRVANSFTGTTVNFLWISELGKIAMEDPIRAAEIARGSLNAVHPGNVVVIESTHRGGRFGLNYEMVRLSRKSPAKPSVMQWKFLFFGWHENPKYALRLMPGEKLTLSDEHVRYFAELEQSTGKKLTDGQKAWYSLKAMNTPKSDMPQEFPGTTEEALRATAEGAIFGDLMALLRARGRICDFPCDGTAPLLTSWDIGGNDATGIWLLQIVGFDIHALDYHCANGASPAKHAAKMIEWEHKHGAPITAHYLPHDAMQRDNIALSWKQALVTAGLRNMIVVPRTPEVWIGINHLRELLPRFRFHETHCEQEFVMPGGTVWPSGVGALEAHRKDVTAIGGALKPMPVHDASESGANSLRTFAEAHARGLLVGPAKLERDSRREAAGPERAIMGLRQPSVTRR